MEVSTIFCLELETFALVYGWFCAIFSSFGIIVSSTLLPLAEDHFMGIDKTCKSFKKIKSETFFMSQFFFHRLLLGSKLHAYRVHSVVLLWFPLIIRNCSRKTYFYTAVDYSTSYNLCYMLDNVRMEMFKSLPKRSFKCLAICSCARDKCSSELSPVLYSHGSVRSLQTISRAQKFQKSTTWRKCCYITIVFFKF